MPSETEIVRDRQLAIRREMDRRGILLKTVSLDSGLSYSTVQSYFPNDRDAVPSVMSVASLYALVGAVPDDLLSLLLPAGRVIVQVPENVDHDEFAGHCQQYLMEKSRAHHPESEMGPAIGPVEDERLRARLTVVKAA